MGVDDSGIHIRRETEIVRVDDELLQLEDA